MNNVNFLTISLLALGIGSFSCTEKSKENTMPHTAHTVAERVVLCRGAWFWNKILQDATAENLDKQ